ncbi:MAG: hypothetical protein QE279_11060 [Rhodoferax sp.]|nr:hypothetical protein [Rhodoferax sp.]
MTEPTTQLSAEEALAIDAIASLSRPVLPQAAQAETPQADDSVDAHFDLPGDAPSGHDAPSAFDSVPLDGDAPYDEAGEGEEDEEEDYEAAEVADIISMRATMLDSAELANRAAGLAAKSATDMHIASSDLQGASGTLQSAASKLIAAQSAQRINGVVVLATFAALMLTSMALFGIMSYRLQSRIAQADAMLLAVGKRIVSMDESMELITGAGETLRDISSKQDSITGGQMKLDARLDDMIAANQAIAKAAALPDAKGPDLAKALQALDAKLQSQASALNALASQVRAAPAQPRLDTAAVRRELEAALRQQKAAEAASKPVIVVPPAPPSPPAKPRETLIQYPRVSSQGKGNETP